MFSLYNTKKHIQEKRMKFTVLSDIHYISPRMIVNDESSRINSLVSRSALYQAAALDNDVMLIHGDITDRGDMKSHEDLREILRDLKSKGKRIYVTTATHDFNHHKAYTRKRGDTDVVFRDNPWNLPFFDKDNADYSSFVAPGYDENARPMLEECLSPEELWDFYREFGRDEAYSVCEGGHSYCVDLDEKTRCLMLNDNFRNEEALGDISPTYSPKTLRWISEMVRKAKEEGKFIFVCTHHPLVPPTPAYRLGTGNRNMRSPYTAHFLADAGINLAFSGHTHFADVGFAESPKHNVLCDITTPSVRNFPAKFRTVEIDAENHSVDYKCVEVEIPEGVDIGQDSLTEYYRLRMKDEYFAKMQKLKSPFNKIVTEGKVSDFYPLCRHCAKLTPEEYASIKDIKIFDIISDTVFNMLSGDGGFTPDTAAYKFLMGLSAVIDSIADAQPFVNVRKKMKGYSVSDVISPLCFNNFAPDNDGKIDFTRKPEPRFEEPVMKTFAGPAVMLALTAAAVPLAKLAPFAAAVGLPALSASKLYRLKKNPVRPDDIY